MRWTVALAAVRKLRAETAVRLTVEARRLDWRKTARHVIDCLPPAEN